MSEEEGSWKEGRGECCTSIVEWLGGPWRAQTFSKLYDRRATRLAEIPILPFKIITFFLLAFPRHEHASGVRDVEAS